MAIAADCKSADFKSTLVRVRSRLNDFGIIAPEMDYPDELSEYLGRKIWMTKRLRSRVYCSKIIENG